MIDTYPSRRGTALRACSAGLLLAIALVPTACKRPKRPAVQLLPESGQQAQILEEAPQAVSTVQMGDRQTEKQLVSGFYGIEANSWRWTAKDFSLNLRAPAGAAQKGATLEGHFVVPSVAIAKNKDVTLSASVGSQKCPPAKYAKAGEYVYKCDAQAGAFSGDSVKVEFTLDKALPPEGGDRRELGIIATSVGITPK